VPEGLGIEHEELTSSAQNPIDGYTPSPDNSYEPPSDNAYVPPSPHDDNSVQQDDIQSPVKEKRRKKSFMDDDSDDDFVTKAAEVLKKSKAQKDREADEAFRKAAEEDGEFLIIVLFRMLMI